MKYHVFAVWDFMSLLKSLQSKICCNKIPWTPPSNNEAARFINEIVLEEETDADLNGVNKSHFELYIEAMIEVKANRNLFNNFFNQISNYEDILELIQKINKKELREFLAFTFNTIESGETHKIAAAFTYGREDIIPDMFIRILDNYDFNNQKFQKLRYYLTRHIELDGDNHGPIAHKLIKTLCGNDERKWHDVEETAISAIKLRINLWNLIQKEILSYKNVHDFNLSISEPN